VEIVSATTIVCMVWSGAYRSEYSDITDLQLLLCLRILCG
jgi:hypothetical protein